MAKTSKSRRNFIMIGAAAVGGAAVASAIELPVLLPQVRQKDDEIKQKDQEISGLQNTVSDLSRSVGFLSLNTKERPIVEAVAETMIPTDDNGPGAKEAGVVYFIDRQLAGSYGKSGGMYMKGPFLRPGQTGPITVDGVVYSKGTPAVGLIRGGAYYYHFNLREYWRRGLKSLQEYAVSVHGSNFEDLAAETRTQILQDLFDNKPTNFEGPTPIEFAFEMYDMVIAGFFTDPVLGGNRGMVGWELTGFNGTNEGFSDGYTPQQLMLSTESVRLKPMSLSDLQEGGE
jgi:gluconate 2-dehydrogenase gamma chain